MTRVRISTTVDGERLRSTRALSGRPDSELFDRAPRLFIETDEAERERAALRALPYDEDPTRQPSILGAAAFVALPYDGDVPADVLRLAAERRAR